MMHVLNGILIVLGLALFEIVSSIDNAVINAEILNTMSAKGRKWFLLWGFIFAVVVMRGLLPWLIIHCARHSAPLLLGIGGTFLLILFLQWLLFSGKKEDAAGEHFFLKKYQSDFAKIFYLEVIDAAFSIDGVVGAFAFTLSVPYILIGNGIGAYVLRQLTVKNIETIQKYSFLKDGAMYAILALSIIMILGACGYQIPEWVSPAAMIIIVGFFFLKSRK